MLGLGLGLGLWPLLFQMGSSGAEELNGVLGGSVTFPLNVSQPFESVSWSRVSQGQPGTIALAFAKEPCELIIPLPAFKKRVAVSEDCGDLTLGQLEQEDTGNYSAEVVLQTKEMLKVSFQLRVYRELLASQLRVTCTPPDGGNGTWLLNCSAGGWEDGATFSWALDATRADPSPGNALISLSWEDPDLNVTCEAANPVSKAFKSISLQQACAAEPPEVRPVTESPQENGGPGATGAVVGTLAALAALAALASAVFALFWRRRKKAAKTWLTNAAKDPELEDPSKTSSAFIGSVSKGQETSGRKGQPQRKPARPSQQTPHTIYMVVQHPKQNPLQRDDEKMRKEQRRETPDKGEKTVYSEISPSPEPQGFGFESFGAGEGSRPAPAKLGKRVPS